jgi:hypothetical protein
MTADEIAEAARRAERAGDMDRYFDLLDAYDAAMSGPGCEACTVVGPLLTGPGTSGRAWRCGCGRVWAPDVEPVPS